MATSASSIPPSDLPEHQRHNIRSLSIRHPKPPPARADPPPTLDRHIHIHHPHYPPAHNLLFKLFAPDCSPGGLQYEYLSVLCGIITGNRWDGWLEERDPTGTALNRRRIDVLPHQIVPPGHYFFCLEPSTVDEPYAVCPSFRDWLFPHNDLPPGTWQQFSIPPRRDGQQLSASGVSRSLDRRDVTCRISGSMEGTQKAHIVPQSEKEWHTANGMKQYQANTDGTSMDNDLANILLLRADLHINFDKPKFTFVPKSTPEDPIPQLVVHLVQKSEQYEDLYHNRTLLQSEEIAPQFLFARLAWTIFPFCEGFLTATTRRRLVLPNENTPGSTTTVWLDGDKVAELSSTSQRSQSRKRGRGDTRNAEEEDQDIVTEQASQAQNPRRPTSSQQQQGQFGFTNAKRRKRPRISRPSEVAEAQPRTTSSSSIPLPRTTSSQSPPHTSPSSGTTKAQRLSPKYLPTASPSSIPHPQTPSSESAPAHPYDSDNDDDASSNQTPLDKLKAAALRDERARSDPDHTWESEEAWAREAEGKDYTYTMNQEEAVRLWTHLGAEFRDG
ncbi:hypothetical protein ACEPPN_015304 [Leptodophora sp. 'Broadleaf-Isolate-01']